MAKTWRDFSFISDHINCSNLYEEAGNCEEQSCLVNFSTKLLWWEITERAVESPRVQSAKLVLCTPDATAPANRLSPESGWTLGSSLIVARILLSATSRYFCFSGTIYISPRPAYLTGHPYSNTEPSKPLRKTEPCYSTEAVMKAQRRQKSSWSPITWVLVQVLSQMIEFPEPPFPSRLWESVSAHVSGKTTIPSIGDVPVIHGMISEICSWESFFPKMILPPILCLRLTLLLTLEVKKKKKKNILYKTLGLLSPWGFTNPSAQEECQWLPNEQITIHQQKLSHFRYSSGIFIFYVCVFVPFRRSTLQGLLFRSYYRNWSQRWNCEWLRPPTAVFCLSEEKEIHWYETTYT